MWDGWVTNDSWAALRARIEGRPAHRSPTRRRGRPSLPSRSGPPAAGGRWSLLGSAGAGPAERARAIGDVLLDRYGVVTRGSVAAERLEGGFAAAYRVLSAFEETGRCQRVYAVEGLGAAQFGLPVRRRPAAQSPAPRDGCTARPAGHRSRQRVRSSSALAGASRHRRSRIGRAARPARWSCSSTACSCSTSNEEGGRCWPGRATMRACAAPAPPCSPRAGPAGVDAHDHRARQRSRAHADAWRTSWARRDSWPRHGDIARHEADPVESDGPTDEGPVLDERGRARRLGLGLGDVGSSRTPARRTVRPPGRRRWPPAARWRPPSGPARPRTGSPATRPPRRRRRAGCGPGPGDGGAARHR